MTTQNFEQQLNLYHGINVYCAIAALIFLVIAIVIFFWLKIPRVFGEITGRYAQQAIDAMTEENTMTSSLVSTRIGEDGRRRRKGRSVNLGTGRLRRGAASGALKPQPQPVITPPPVTENTAPVAGAYANNGFQQNSAGQQFQQKLEWIEPQGGEQPTDVLNNFGDQPTDVLNNYGDQPTDVLSNFNSQPTDTPNAEDEQPTEQLDMDPDATALLRDMNEQPVPASESALQTPVYQEPDSETMVLSPTQLNQNQAPAFVVLRSIIEIHTDEVM